MAARKLNRERGPPELVLAQGPVPTSRLAARSSTRPCSWTGTTRTSQLLENRPKTTAGTYRSHVKGFLRYLAINYPSVALCEVTKLQVGLVPSRGQPGDRAVTRSTPVRCP